MNVFVEYLKMYKGNTVGDKLPIDYELYKELESKGIVRQANILCEEIKKQPSQSCNFLTYQNIKGQKYRRNKVDIVVLTRNKKQIKSVFEEEKSLNSFTVIESDFLKSGKGFAENCNIGAKINKSLGEFILFLNDDVIIDDKESFLMTLLQPFKDEKVGMVGTQCSQTSFGINGSVMCIRRELFEAFGGFDENYFFMWEDNDMCKNITKRGYTIEISKAKAEHKGKDSMNIQSEFWRKYYYLGKSYFENKWFKKDNIIGSLIVGDENDRYMTEIILDLFKRKLIDYLTVVCDDSNLQTIKELENLKQYLPITIYKHDFKLFGKAENLLRERAVNYAMSFNPFGIIPIDADEILDEELDHAGLIELLMRDVAVDFYIAHFWGDKNNIRVDGIFGHQVNVRLFRVLWNESTKFYNKNLHCGSAPIYAYSQRKRENVYFRHYGYVRKEDIIQKKIRQSEYDPKMLLENPDLYNKMMSDEGAKIIPFNKLTFLEICKTK